MNVSAPTGHHPLRTAGHQPDYLPYGGFFARMLMVDAFVLVDHVQFEKKSFQSRNRIAGDVQLSVPVRTHGRFTQPIAAVEIAEPEGRWRTRHWRSLQQCYAKAGAFSRHEPFFADLYSRAWTRLVDLNLVIIEYLCRCFGIDTPLVRSSALAVGRPGTELLVELCHAVGAQEYVSGPGGLDYVKDAVLLHAGLRSTYARYQPVPYPRRSPGSAGHLSAVDLLFHAGAGAGAVLRASIAGPPVPRGALGDRHDDASLLEGLR
jgi:hypothetical protein